MLVVLDTNLLVSALLSPLGKEASVVELVSQQAVFAAVSTSILNEYEAVLSRPKFNFDPDEVDRTLYPIRTYSLLTHPGRRLTISPDDSDNRFLECAEASGADFLITGNKRHFPDHHGKTKIVNAREFLDAIGKTR
jgi:putative PIN family toxin of toxin-antitoxin system